ncbi:HAD-IC family P-type ATPase [Pseudoclavibacter chungangensis]|uniref:HAD-IC family P-type ATPase n=1 Tax=Pseudoclavibacter chungangensis TaxID=587635 RepID=A0A7J5BMU1_9MICO|nr:HAD-IC family P-type ATPase [Pseudoclavibacter chungangensis]KAB1652984.1 HAD-IC family P-type ATPase [Pseudoclavibacter chungangensis]NYJ65215.1 magnesium-transporting ATPase (P-type) [Pseudoclavibacter chungangensis]
MATTDRPSDAPLVRDTPWAAPSDEVLLEFRSAPAGLTGTEATERLGRDGRNELPEPPRPSLVRRLLSQYNDVLTYILIGAAVLKAITADWVDFTVIVVVIVATGLVGFVQEGRATSALAGLRRMQSLDAKVLRDGTWGVVDAAELVVGDVVRVRSGDRVPADVRLLDAHGLQVDESALTGESLAADKGPDAVQADAGLGDRSSMLFSGTIATAGTGEGVVVAIGSDTAIGRISALVAEQDEMDTPLARQLARLGGQLSILIAGLALVMLLVGYFVHGLGLEDLISAAIGFAVAAVPEGLPALVTITLALGVQQMAKRRAITRKMAAVETLGSTTTICSDKTGTLTQNEMTARAVVTPSGSYAVTGTGYAPEGAITTVDGAAADAADHPDLDALVVAATLCNDASVERDGDGWRVVGQPTEGALRLLADKAGADTRGARRIAAVPFESSHKFAATLDELPGDDGPRRIVHVVGAPDRLLDRSAHERTSAGELVALDRAAWDGRIDELSARGLRVLAVAVRGASDDDDTLTLEEVDDGLTFLGVVGIVDPPRPEATAAIAEAHGAGIRVKMITGDHRGTATAIARELGLAPERGEVPVLSGAELTAMSDEELAHVARDVDVYARTSPEHKLRIVRALQSRGEVVAMTGDGVNDAPSITRADVGVAMGVKGTEATKEAADIVLADDNFATIERAVEEGRRIYDNIRKSVVFLLPTNGAQSLVVLVAVLAGLALPLTPVQILWINLATALTLSLSLAGEPAEPGIMKRPPRSSSEQVLSSRALVVVLFASVVLGGVTLAVYLIERARTGDVQLAQTTAVLMLAIGQLAFLLNCRFLNSSSLTPRVLRGNPAIWGSAAALIALQLAFTYLPFMNAWFGTKPIGIEGWLLTAVFAVGVFLLVEVAKLLTRLGARRATVTTPDAERATVGTHR